MMTEDQWLSCQNSLPMLAAARDTASPRQLQLFAVACCRLVWDLLPDERSRRAVEAAERYADGEAGEADLRVAKAAADAAHQEDYRAQGKLRVCVSRAAVYVVDPRACQAARWASWMNAAAGGGGRLVTQAALVRDLLGNPFRPLPPLAPSVLAHNGGIVRRLAEAAYLKRELPRGHLLPERLAVLADALEEAGVCDAVLLGHLRDPGPHVRGCWAVDLLLNRS